MTLLAWQYSVHLDQLAAQQKFVIVAQSAHQLLGRQIDTCLQSLFDLRGFLSANQSITKNEFETYARNIQIQQHYPGIHMLGYLPRVRQQEKNAFEIKQRKEGFPQYRIKSVRSQPEYFPEFYIYPSSDTLFGNNLYERATRGLIMDQARDDNRPQATAKTVLDTDPKKRAAFVIYLPVYHDHMPLTTVQERRRALKGFVFEAFIVEELVKTAIGEFPGRQFKLDLMDSSTITRKNLLFDSDQWKDFDEIFDKSQFKYITHLSVGGRNWTLAFHPRQAFYLANKSSTPNVVLFGGLLTSLLLAGITFQINARRRLRWAKEEQDQHYRSLFDQHPDAVYSMDLEGNITSANATAARYAGLPSEKLQKTSFAQFISKDRLPEAMEWFRKAVRGKPAQGETVAIGENGQRFDLNVTHLPIVVGDRVVGVFGIAKDITPRKRAQAQLKATEERLNSILESMEEVVWSLSADGSEVLFLNHANEKIYGRRSEEFFANPRLWMDVAHPKDQDRVQDFIPQLLSTGSISMEYRIVQPDDQVRWVRDRGKVIYDAHGKATRLDGMMTDITEQVLAERESRKQRQLLEGVIDTLPINIFIRDADARTVMVNAHGAGTLDKAKSEIIGRTVFDLLPREIAEGLVLRDQSVLASGETAVFEERMIRYGKECYVLAGRTVLNIEGEPPLLLGYSIDITERKQAEEALRQARDELEVRVKERTADLSKANTALKELSAHLQRVREEERTRAAREIHDELGGILAAVKFDLSIPVKRGDIDASGVEKRNQATAQLVDKAIHSLRRIMADLRPSVLDDLGLWATLEWQVQDFEARHGIHCCFEINGPELDLDPDLATAIFRIVQESLNNVAKHAQATEVLMVATVTDDEISVVIEDNGRGISDAEKQGAKSFGILGMEERTRAFGGSVQITRNTMKGTTVVIRLPWRFISETA